MKTDGSVIIDTKIVEGGLEKGLEQLKDHMGSVGVAVEDLGNKLKFTFSENTTVGIENAVIRVQRLERALENITADLAVAVSEDNDSAAQRLAARQQAVYDQLEAARRRLAQVVVQEAKKEEKAEQKAAQKALKEKEKVYKKATKSAKAFGKRLTSIMAGALVFNIISQGLRSVTQYFGKALKSNKKFSESWSKLKGAAMTAIQPIYEVLLPVLTTAVDVASKLMLLLGKAFASLTGKSAAQMKENAEALNEQANATEKAGDAAEKAKKQMAGFDEINTLGSNNSSETETSSANFEFQSIDVNGKLTEMAELASEAILALGIILTLTGANIPLGLGMIVFGGLALYESIEENWGGPRSQVISSAESIALIGGAVTLAVGIIICFACPSHLSLGLGLVIGSATLLGTEVALNWSAIEDALKDPVVAAVAAIGGAFLVVIGILLCVAQQWLLGIGLIVSGAAFLAGSIGVNWGSISAALKSPLGAAVAIMAGAVLVVIGIFACVAQMWVLGISCIVAGAAGLATAVAINWNAISDAMQGPIGKIVAIVSASLLVLGIILLFVPGAQGLALGLLIAGAAGLAATAAFNWNSIVEWVKKAWDGVKKFWNQHIAKVFTGKFWKDLAKKCGNGLIAGFEAAVNGIISIFEKMINWVVGGLNKISFDVPDWVPGIGGTKFGFNIPEAKFKRVSIPRLAQGAVIPPNREFLAVLGDQNRGTNVEAPLETIKQALAEVMAETGGGETVVTINFTGSLSQLARVLKPEIETETRRKGTSLATGGSY